MENAAQRLLLANSVGRLCLEGVFLKFRALEAICFSSNGGPNAGTLNAATGIG